MGRKSRFYADIMSLHDNVTGSCHPVCVKLPNDERIMFIVDCGLFLGRESKENRQKFTFKPENIDFCLVTHNHVDHTGKLPLMVKEGFRGKIYTTYPTSCLLQPALTDSYSVLKGNAKANGEEPLYSEEDVNLALDLVSPCEYGKNIEVNCNIRVNFFENCHLPGAAFILVRICYPGEKDINLLFTGDCNQHNVFLDDVCLPEWVLNLPLTVIQESTYGDTDADEIIPCFDNNLLKAIEEGKTVLVPVLSLGRAQEILYRLKCLQKEGKLAVDIPIYLDGKLSIVYTGMYLKGLLELKSGMEDFLPENLVYVDKALRSILLTQDNNCKIILTSSGMGSFGPARSYIPAFLGRKNVLIHFTCYQAENTLGWRIKSTPTGEETTVAGMNIVKRARVEYTSEFSAHAKADEMIEFLQQFNKLLLVLINHGESETRKIFSKRVLKEVETQYVGILNHEILFRVDSIGFVKTINTKFI